MGRGNLPASGSCKERLGAGHPPDDASSGRVALANGLGWKLLAGSVLWMWKRWQKGCLRLWEAGIERSSGGKGLGPPTANTERMRLVLT